MPKELERKLLGQGKAQGLTGKDLGAYVYGTMQKTTSWRPPGNRKKKKP